MILALFGVFVTIAGVFSESGGALMIAIGVILIFFGCAVSSVSSDMNQAKGKAIRYWANYDEDGNHNRR